MTKADILYKYLNVCGYTLSTRTVYDTEVGAPNTIYYVTWDCKGCGTNQMEHTISKEDYRFLLEEMNKR